MKTKLTKKELLNLAEGVSNYCVALVQKKIPDDYVFSLYYNIASQDFVYYDRLKKLLLDDFSDVKGIQAFIQLKDAIVKETNSLYFL